VTPGTQLRSDVYVPTPLRARQATALHDLHHVLTGYGADFVGEFEISAWEVGAGLGSWWPLWLITFPSFLLGWLVCPLPIWRFPETMGHGV